MSETRQKIEPILYAIYGKGSMVSALAAHLSEVLDGYKYDPEDRETLVMQTCWNWFSGGDTATSAARKIEAVLP